jgi:hypothetical protein
MFFFAGGINGAGSISSRDSYLGRIVKFLGRYEVTIMVLLGYLVFFNVMDMLSTALALRIGLEEGNVLLLNISSFLRTNLLVVIGLIKILFIFGGAGLVFMGIKTNNRRMKNLILGSILAFVLVFLLVSVNNVYLILY